MHVHVHVYMYAVHKSVKNGYWPSSLKSMSYIFHQDIPRQWNAFQKQMPGTSQKRFLEGLGDFSSIYIYIYIYTVNCGI